MYRRLLPILLLIDLISLLSHYVPVIGVIAWTVLVVTTLLLGIRKRELMLVPLLLELVVGSYGYVFALHLGSSMGISLRLGIFLVIFMIWFIDVARRRRIILWPTSLHYFFLAFIAVISIGFIEARLYGIPLHNTFLDANAFLFFALIGYVAESLATEYGRKLAINVLIVGALYVSIKTILLAWIFAQPIGSLGIDLYQWLRDTRVAEITTQPGALPRIFMQSQIFLLVASALVCSQLIWNNSKQWISKIFVLGCFAAALLLSFSRSYWIGWFVLLITIIIYTWKRLGIRVLLPFAGQYTLALFVALLMITAIRIIPLPGFDSATLGSGLFERTRDLSQEPAAQSRWSLLPAMSEGIARHPLFGSGFGATLTYQSYDPRLVAQNKSLNYTTYSFEWGWLDITYKIGTIGMIIFAGLLLMLIYQLLRIPYNDWIDNAHRGAAMGLGIGLMDIAVVHFFSPYLNHPLGIGVVLVSSGFLLSLRVGTGTSDKTTIPS